MSEHRPLPDGPVVAWYGDDYTGAAAVMEVLSFAGLPSVLFLAVPTPLQLARFADRPGIGIAGSARSRGPAWMDAHLPAAFRFLASLDAPVTHYKICSTLDSAPHVGSIGKAIELALETLPAQWVALLTAAPTIGRYQAFGNLFAASGAGVQRLDRHSVMARHPVTPMGEADVRRHVAAQTALPIGLVALDALQDDVSADRDLAQVLSDGARIVALDSVDAATEAAAGRLIWQRGGHRALVAGSQGVEYALVRHWREAGLIEDAGPAPKPEPAAHVAVVSGSASPTTDAQIAHAAGQGFTPVRLDPRAALYDKRARSAAVEAVVQTALDAGGDPIVFTARGPDDPAIAAFREAAAAAGVADDEANAAIGQLLGDVLDTLLARSGWQRAVIAGGDTASHGARRLGIIALTAKAATVPGAALCDAHFDDPETPPFEIVLKGGQMGGTDFFVQVRDGLAG